MKPYIELKGASGAVYRYKLAENGDPGTTIAGNYVYVDARGDVVYAGEANNLIDAKSRWADARARHGATWLYTRLNVSGASRADEYSDIVIALQPVMNQAD
ncbi:hypothetical protein [uncultured Caulobacter sp.]|uniref:hypothetical protein n=1 Tax=uncultured Caulobacter sp. TaxID=158749 RepID=UPI00261403E8|nr:hypothetical protein [uncultured Caulobacter sp.]